LRGIAPKAESGAAIRAAVQRTFSNELLCIGQFLPGSRHDALVYAELFASWHCPRGMRLKGS
jgi:hypothetical protein